MFANIELKKDHWSQKLMEFAFPGQRRFDNFCPHFWMTILAIFLAIPIVIGRVLLRFSSKIISIMSTDITQDYYNTLTDEEKNFLVAKFFLVIATILITYYTIYFIGWVGRTSLTEWLFTLKVVFLTTSIVGIILFTGILIAEFIISDGNKILNKLKTITSKQNICPDITWKD